MFFANSSCSARDRLVVAEYGFSLRYTDPAAMLAWCEAAAVNLSPSTPASEASMLLAHLGNAHRVACNFQEAEIYLRRAIAKAPANPLILEFYASLLKDKRQLEEATDFLSRAATLRRAAGDNSGFVTTLLQFALVLDESGFPDQAAGSVLRALDIIGLLPKSEERERLARAAFQNLASYLVNAGKPGEALWIVSSCRDRLMLGGEVFRLRIDWLIADIAGALGDIENAVATYEQVRNAFIELGHPQEVAVVTLDLARLLLKPRPLQARQEALSVRPILESLEIPSDSREARLLEEVIETGAEAALIELTDALRANGLARRRA